MNRVPRRPHAFTLIEMLVVISIIIILMGLLFPAFKGVQDQAKRTQAKNDLTQIATAVSGFYTEYGRYPLTPSPAADTTYGGATVNGSLFNVLRNISAATENPRGIIFMSPPDAKDQSKPRNGIKTTTGEYFDPWGVAYNVKVDTDYDNYVDNPYSSNAGTTKNPVSGNLAIQAGIIAWSLGKDGAGGSGDKAAGQAADDVLSWQ